MYCIILSWIFQHVCVNNSVTHCFGGQNFAILYLQKITNLILESFLLNVRVVIKFGRHFLLILSPVHPNFCKSSWSINILRCIGSSRTSWILNQFGLATRTAKLTENHSRILRLRDLRTVDSNVLITQIKPRTPNARWTIRSLFCCPRDLWRIQTLLRFQ